MNTTVWKCGNCLKVFESYKKLIKHIDRQHHTINCQFCGKMMKKGSMYIHVNRFHTQKNIMDLTEVSAPNNQLDQSMDQSIQEIINSIDSQQEIFQDVNMEEYMQVFDEVTSLHSKIPTEEESQESQDVNMEEHMQVFDEVTSLHSKTPTEEEFNEIQQYWLNLPDEEFAIAEDVDWAATL